MQQKWKTILYVAYHEGLEVLRGLEAEGMSGGQYDALVGREGQLVHGRRGGHEIEPQERATTAAVGGGMGQAGEQRAEGGGGEEQQGCRVGRRDEHRRADGVARPVDRERQLGQVIGRRGSQTVRGPYCIHGTMA